MSSNTVTLTLKGTSDLKTMVTDLRNVGTESQKAGAGLKTATTELDKGAKSATTFGQKIKGFGSTFSTSIASIGTLGSTVLNLSRQYQDLSDSQIRVDRMQLKVSKTTEAIGKAQDKLNLLTAKGVTSGSEYEQALLDVKQGLEAQDLAERNLQEAQEDHQRAQENFWIGLVPTVTSAGTSVISVLKDIGGTKGFGGLKTALGGLKTAFTGFTGIGGIATGLSGIGTAANGSVVGMNGMAGAATTLGASMKSLALSVLPVAIAIGGIALIVKSAGMVIHEITSIMKGDMLEAVTSVSKLIDFYDKLAAVAPMGAGFKIFSSLKDEAAKLKKELEGVPQTVHAIDPAFQQLDNTTQGINKTIDSLVGSVLGFNRKAAEVPAVAEPAGNAISGIGTAASTAAPSVDGVTTALTSMSNQATITGQGMSVLSDGTVKATDSIALVIAATDPFNAKLNQAAGITHFMGTELDLLTRSAQMNANAFQKESQAVSALANILTKATKNATAYVKASQKISGPSFQYGAPGKGPSGSHYTTFRNGVPIASGSGMAPPLRKAAMGMHETVSHPTWILAGEAGDERVDIGRPGSSQRGGGGSGGFYGTVNVYVDGVLRPARYDMGARK